MVDVHEVAEVFGVVRGIPKNYTVRSDVDGEFLDALKSNKHVVIYGSSKQGKTSLRKKNLAADKYESITCQNNWDISSLMGSMLKKVGYSVERSTKVSVSGHAKISVSAKIKASLLGTGGEGAGSTDIDGTAAREVEKVQLELDPEDINDIISALRSIGFNKWLVLEDFHYLPDETQRSFATALKSFHENSNYTFIIVGVWLEENRLIQYNGDLNGRVVTINADRWNSKDLRAAIEKGELLLNVTFSDSFKSEIIKGAKGSIYLVQESCLRALRDVGLERTSETVLHVDAPGDEIIQHVVNTQSGGYRGILPSIADGFQSTDLEMHKWLLVPIVLTSLKEHEDGISLSTITSILKEHHPRQSDLNQGNITNALKSLVNVQVKRGVKPIVLDYDQARRRLNVVDRGFLIWLSYQKSEELLDEVGIEIS